MANNYVYVLMDSASNQVTTSGVGLRYLREAMKKLPRNIIILSGNTNIGTFDDYTRFQIIRGEKSVDDFIDRQQSLSRPRIKWIDYTSQELLHQLEPGEIAELLYLAHAERHWHSPFFYKLQNNYVCLPGDNGLVKMYYRYISEFYYQLSCVMRDELQERMPVRRALFSVKSAGVVVNQPSMKFMQSIQVLFNEGIVFAFNEVKTEGGRASFPVYLAEDQFEATVTSSKSKHQLAVISYDEKDQTWSVDSEYIQDT